MKNRPSCLFSRASEVPAGLGWLGAAERQHLAGLRLAKRRAEWLLGRWTAKQALVQEPETELNVAELAVLEILPSPAGAPRVFLEGSAVPIALSLSHRAGAAFCAVARVGSVGCDLEWVEDRSAGFIEDYFTVSERILIEERGTEKRALMANAMWSAKESVLKLLGLGLSVDTRSLIVDSLPVPQAGEWQPFKVHRHLESRVFTGWWRRQDNWVLTVASDPDSRCPSERNHLGGGVGCRPPERGGRHRRVS